jgi:transposase
MDGDLSLADRTFRCEHCGLVIDRDLNAAKNLATLAGSSSERRNACGAASSGLGLATQVKLAVMKQEPDAFDASA